MLRPLPFVLAALLALPPAAGAQAGKLTVKKLAPLSLGLAGYTGAEAARADSEALQRYLSTRLHREVTTRVFGDSDALAAALASGAIDLGWMQPFTLVQAQAKGKIVPIAKAVRHGLPFYRGVIFAKTGAKIDGLKGLQGLKVGWVNAGSAAGYLFPRASLVHAGFVPKKLFAKEEFLGDHASVCRAVLEGRIDVGATFADDRPAGETARVDGCQQALGLDAAAGLRIVATSAPIPNDAVAARPGLDAEDVTRVRQALLGLKADPEGRALLMAVFKAEDFDAVGAEDFEPVRFAIEAAAR